MFYLLVFQLLFLSFNYEKSNDEIGVVTIGVDWSRLNCGPGTAKIYIDKKYEGELLVSIDTIQDCFAPNVLTLKKTIGEYEFNIIFKDDCFSKRGRFNVSKDSCTKVMVKF